MSLERDFDWQRGLIPEVKRILANYLIAEAPPAEDMQRNTDLIVLRLDTVRVACRLRRHEYLARYGDQFTIRTSRPSGAQTELAKMLSGWGDYLFYGFASADAGELAAARTAATAILEDAGVAVTWVSCDAVFVRRDDNPCRAPLAANEA